jgi:FkbM family methyltransferase
MVNTANFFTDIVIDTRSGRIDNASVHEKLALILMRVIVTILRPFHLFGMSYAARLVRKILPSRKSIKFVLADDSVMRVDYCDAYWVCLIVPNHVYEPVMLNFLTAFKDTPYAFIDGGANHGYWSVLASSKAFGSHKVIAVEAASDTYSQLEENRILNGDRFLSMNRAIGATSNEPVRIYGVKHEARTMVATEGAVPILDCISVSLDDLADDAFFKAEDAYAVKLDVEGVEVIAMNAATRLLQKKTLFFFEDHGSDTSHEATRNAMENLGLRIFWIGGQKPVEIRDLTQLNAIKQSRRCGYDMAATKSDYWLNKLAKLALQTTPVAA